MNDTHAPATLVQRWGTLLNQQCPSSYYSPKAACGTAHQPPNTQPQTIRLRDGELVLYRHSRSLLYHCHYRLADGTCVRQPTSKVALEHTIARACDTYDEDRYWQRLGLAHRAHSVAQIAAVYYAALGQRIDAKGNKKALNDHVERFNETYRTEVLDCCVLDSLQKVRQMTVDWLHRYNRHRPHESLGRIPHCRIPCETTPQPLLLTGAGIRGGFGTN